MTRNSDEADRGGPLDALCDVLRQQLERGVVALKQIDLEDAGALEVQRFVRAVELTARAADAVLRLEGRGVRPTDAQTEEDMSDDDFDDSPEGLERARDELDRRLGDLQRTFEQKGMAFRPGCWPVALVAEGSAGHSGPPDPDD